MCEVLADILCVKVLEASESLAVKENQDGNDLGIGKPSGLIAMLLAITELILFEFRGKMLAEIIGKTENFSNLFSVIIAQILVKNVIRYYKFTNFLQEHQENQPLRLMLNG